MEVNNIKLTTDQSEETEPVKYNPNVLYRKPEVMTAEKSNICTQNILESIERIDNARQRS